MFSARLFQCLLGMSALVYAGPCDIYASGGTPCVAAHSSTRALYNSYDGDLYQLVRASDDSTLEIGLLSTGGAANVAPQDSFCVNTICNITTIYDQSGKGNHLTQAPPGQAATGAGKNDYDILARASVAPHLINGNKVYGVYIIAGVGYRNDKTTGVATGDEPEGIYAVLSGTHYNTGCCFDYGNAETTNTDPGAGYMEAIYFGNRDVVSSGAGSGPWIEADLENGLYGKASTGNNPNNPSMNFNLVTAMVKGNSGNEWAIRGGDGVSGALTTIYSGVRPSGYSPMKKEGAIVLGVGGDNSDAGAGTFFEGAMTTGYPSDATENSVQANIVAAKYGLYS
ncbi:putative alpha-L-arabinofuranosidase B [Lachnellula suecica]|uniref:Alpha-L-arabinofuranosidase n=1 Tax=Lachnellula suecica TaxID=602035 RepID=A0A8T9CJ52_9HELO|nr:putative alpha-L-arabinofuranosidase B [Lachnellula suecica]